jgi:hypothetical protein
LLNNAAKALFLRGKEKKDLFLAIGTWYFVLDKYGKDQNYHHRAAVLHWITMAYKKLGCMGPAKDSAIASMKLWKKQLTIDPLNKAFIEKYEKAQDLVNELS